MVRTVLNKRTAKMFTETIQQFQRDVHREWHTDTYECWKVSRPEGWVDDEHVEADIILESGFGKLYANGKGGPQTGEMVIHLESPYRFRTLTTADIQSGNLMVINGSRVFRVDITKPEHDGDVLMDVYLTELFNTPVPEVA